jgi:hypothetical protein
MGKNSLEKEPNICYIPNLKMPFFDAGIPIIIPILIIVAVGMFFAQFFRSFFVDVPHAIIGIFKKSDKQKDFEQRIAAMSANSPESQPSSRNISQSSSPYDTDTKPVKTGKVFCSYCGSENIKQGDFCQNCGKKFD